MNVTKPRGTRRIHSEEFKQAGSLGPLQAATRCVRALEGRRRLHSTCVDVRLAFLASRVRAYVAHSRPLAGASLC